MVLLLFTHCFLFVSLIVFVMLYLVAFLPFLLRRQEFNVLLKLSSWCPVTVSVTVPWVGLQCVIKVFWGHTHLLFDKV